MISDYDTIRLLVRMSKKQMPPGLLCTTYSRARCCVVLIVYIFPPVFVESQVFVGGLRESEDAVHITEEELATYFSKFGVIESVSINRDDRTHRGRGFAFVKFFQEVGGIY